MKRLLLFLLVALLLAGCNAPSSPSVDTDSIYQQGYTQGYNDGYQAAKEEVTPEPIAVTPQTLEDKVDNLFTESEQTDSKESTPVPTNDPTLRPTTQPTKAPTPKPTAKPTTKPTPESVVEAPKSQTVYITDTGKKYHRDGCQYLSKSKHAIDLEKAISSGYTACSKCW